MSYLAQLTVLLSSLAAVLAWVVQILYARSRIKAKDAALQAKDAVIESKDAKIEVLSGQLDMSRSLEATVLLEKLRVHTEQWQRYIPEYEERLRDREAELLKLREGAGDARAQADRLEREVYSLKAQLMAATTNLEFAKALQGIGALGSVTIDGSIPPLLSDSLLIGIDANRDLFPLAGVDMPITAISLDDLDKDDAVSFFPAEVRPARIDIDAGSTGPE